MPVNVTDLDAAFATMEAEITRAETVGGSAVAALNNQAAAIIAAVEADNAIDKANTDRFKAIVESVNARLTANTTAIETAVLANTPPPAPAQ